MLKYNLYTKYKDGSTYSTDIGYLYLINKLFEEKGQPIEYYLTYSDTDCKVEDMITRRLF